jgi:hypothetical protein
MRLGGALVPHRLTPRWPVRGADSRRERIEHDAHVGGHHDALPRGGDGVWMTSTTRGRVAGALGHKHKLLAALPPERSLGGWDRQTVTRETVTRAGRKARRDVLSPEIGCFTESSDVGACLPGRCLRSSSRGDPRDPP